MSVQPAVAQPAVAEQTVTEPRHPALREHNKQRRAKFENRVADGITQFAGSIWVSQADSRVRSRENIRAARSALGIGSVVTSRSPTRARREVTSQRWCSRKLLRPVGHFEDTPVQRV